MIRPGGVSIYGDASRPSLLRPTLAPIDHNPTCFEGQSGRSESFVNGFRLSITDLHGLIITNRQWNGNRYFGLVEWRNVKALDTAACPIESPFTHSTVREPEFKQFGH